MDVEAVHEAAERAVARARAGEGPTLLEALTYRFRGHSMQDPQYYRSKEEIEEYRKRDPITLFQGKLLADGLVTEAELRDIDERIEAEVDAAVRFADESPAPDPSTLLDHLYADED
jgi:pyruvate dehydrogenase E1 component alpha subunit